MKQNINKYDYKDLSYEKNNNKFYVVRNWY